MPIFDFYCPKCNIHTEKIVKHSNLNKVKCENCGGKMNREYPLNKMNFKLVYNTKKDIVSWGSQGYSTTQRNRDIKDGK